MNSCRIFEEDSKAHSAHYKSQNERKVNKSGNCGKPYSTPVDKENRELMMTVNQVGEKDILIPTSVISVVAWDIVLISVRVMLIRVLGVGEQVL